MTDFLSAGYWSNRYTDKKTGWDIGMASTPIKEYIDQLENKDLKILIPGCGFGYEGEYLFKNGFSNVNLLDFSLEPLISFKDRNPDFPESQLHIGDFFEHQGNYDLILEQTLFCAIDPALRMKYAEHISELLKPGGKLVGLLFNREFEGGPPFGGNKEEYEIYFNPFFTSVKMDDCYNSIESRKGNELFIRMTK